jgi:hypothetical protein
MADAEHHLPDFPGARLTAQENVMPMSCFAFRRNAVALLLAGTACASHATLITFDERPWVLGPEEYAFWSNPIDGEYDALGVDFGTAYLQPADPDSNFSKSQFILGPNGYSISFTGSSLPTFVSLAFSSPIPDSRATVRALGTNGQLLGSADTGGSYYENGELVSTPYHPLSHASFHSEAGISRLQFGTATGFRLEAKFDNLYFGNVPAVPEPASVALWAVGLGVLGMARWRRHRNT